MRTHWTSLFSAFAVPVLGVGALLLSLWHSNLTVKASPNEQSMVYLLDPDPRLDKVLTICLRQQAKEVIRCQARLCAMSAQESHASLTAEARLRRDGLAQAISDYNLVAQECTPAVFQTTHLPPSLKP